MELRFATSADAEALLKIYAPYVEKTAITFEYEVPSLAEFKQRITTISQRYPYLVAVEDGKIIGYAYVSAFKERKAYDWAVETSIYLDQTQRQKGLGTRMYQALEEILKLQEITNVNACITYCNPEDEYVTLASVKFHEKRGFHLVGKFSQCGYKFNRWYDMIWMEKFIQVHQKIQPAFKPIGTILTMAKPILAKYSD
ncbi:phosphinothricin acetyltransferase [Ligilactobacillus sp. WC1T17]|uniref:Phosphinothricin acetyltransferase n=1 Tax=Ligilactobacillus ruminis TaxID=1623 RepID=A0ABY1AAD0_9LACO|nr:phosphinothricin acetyltransferase [Ligilactobacillus ruminis]